MTASRVTAGKEVVFRLAVKDLRHEWILTVCMIMAISAVLAPLLLLFGLKYGIIEWGREYLTQDPRYREIRPLASKTFTGEWFETIRKRAGVAYAVPMTRQISATVKAGLKGREIQTELNVIPTSDGDPLILENGAAVPRDIQCVLTRFAAEAMGVKTGDVIEIQASRVVGSRYEYGTLDMTVAGVLSVRASELKSVYVRLPVLEAVEKYKDGQAVPEFHWPGSTPKAYPLYDGVILVMAEPLDKVEEMNLRNRTGFTKIETMTPESLRTLAGFRVSPEKSVYRLYTQTTPAGEESVAAVVNRLRGRDVRIFPWSSGLSGDLVAEGGRKLASLNLFGLTPAMEDANIGLSPSPPWTPSPDGKAGPLTILLPAGVDAGPGPVFLQLTREEGDSLRIPVSVADGRGDIPGAALIPDSLAGVLRLFRERNLHFDAEASEFTLLRRGYAGFRLYAATINDVDGLRRYFEEIAIPVHTEIKEIKKVIELDKGMTLIFWLLAAVGIAGCVASLTASLYASVERKKREMAVLRLIGLSGMKLIRFPVYQGVMIGSGGFFASLAIFAVFSRLINEWFRPYADKLLGFPMDAGVSFCHLPMPYVVGIYLAAVLIAAIAATLSAIRVAAIEPAEALRDE